MKNEFNMTNSLNEVGNKIARDKQRIQEQTSEYLRKYYEGLREGQEQEAADLKESMLSGAAFSQSSAYMKNKQRVQLMEKSIKYNNRAATIVMADYLANIVESSLLMETEEFAVLNPAYQADIRETVLAFLENADLNDSVNEKRTLKIMEHISRNLPDVKTGIYLKEEEIVDIVKKATPKEVNDSIENLIGDVKSKVANLVSKEQSDEEELQDQIDEIVAISEAAKAVKRAKSEVKGQKKKKTADKVAKNYKVDPSVTSPEDAPVAADMMGDPAIAAETAAANTPLPVEDPVLVADSASAPTVDASADGAVAITDGAGKQTSISILPDGKVEIKIKESFYRETPANGVLETFALNEALEMIEEGREYNGELAIGNALMYITILETFNVTGLLNMQPVDYKRIAERHIRK